MSSSRNASRSSSAAPGAAAVATDAVAPKGVVFVSSIAAGATDTVAPKDTVPAPGAAVVATDAAATCVTVQVGGSPLPMGVPLLFIDASAPRVQTGLWLSGHWLAHQSTEAAALEEIFRSVQALLAQAGLPFNAIGGFIHNEGPGSILGIRLCAMALRVWTQGAAINHEAPLQGQGALADYAAAPEAQPAGSPASSAKATLPIWAVRSLPLVAAKVALDQPAPEAGSVGGVFSEFRQGLWNWFAPSADDVFGEGIEVIETEELARRLAACGGRVWHLRHRKSWEAPPGPALEADSNLRDCPQVFLLPGLLRGVTQPEALLTRAPEFKTASGERHRGSGQSPAAAAVDKAGKISAADKSAQAPAALKSPEAPAAGKLAETNESKEKPSINGASSSNTSSSSQSS